MSYCDSAEFRLNTAIYLHYVEITLDGNPDYKRISEEEFKSLLYTEVLDTIDVINFDLTFRHRLADRKCIWRDRYKLILGVVWEYEDVKSYWIDKKVLDKLTTSRTII